MATSQPNGAITAFGVPSTLRSVTPASVPPSTSALYRGATVDDLQLAPAVSVLHSSPIRTALAVAHDRDYSQLPLLGEDRKLLGYVDVADLAEKVRAGQLGPDQSVQVAMKKFSGSRDPAGGAGKVYTVIEPSTGLGQLEVFLRTHPFALVTDPSRSFVLGVATADDLNRYVNRRGLRGQSDDARDGAKTPTGAENADTAMTSANSAPPQLTRREEEERRKDRTLAEFLRLLDGYTPLIPDQVTEHYLEKVGFECDDLRIKRLLALAAEKFVSDIATDAFQYARTRTNAVPAGGARKGGPAAGAAGAGVTAGAAAAQNANDRTRTVLTMDDLSAALAEYGVNARRADFFR